VNVTLPTMSSSSSPPLLTLLPELLLKVFYHMPNTNIISISGASELFRAYAISDHVFAALTALCAQYRYRVRSVSMILHPYR
jgi:hypothetical protein